MVSWEIGQQKGHSFLILPVVAGELFYLSENGQRRESALAQRALENAISAWKFFKQRALESSIGGVVTLRSESYRGGVKLLKSKRGQSTNSDKSD